MIRKRKDGYESYTKIRDILGNEVWRDNETQKEFLVKWTKSGKPIWRYLK